MRDDYKRNRSMEFESECDDKHYYSNYVPGEIVSQILIHVPIRPLVLQFRRVCKEWRLMLHDPVFAKLNYYSQTLRQIPIILFIDNNSYRFHAAPLEFLQQDHHVHEITLLPVDIKGNGSWLPYLPRLAFPPLCCCHDIVLLHPHCYHLHVSESANTKILALWKPLTNQFLDLTLPSSTIHTYNDGEYTYRGLGYDIANYDYKVVFITRRLSTSSAGQWNTLIYSLKSQVWRVVPDFPVPRQAFTMDVDRNGKYIDGELHWIVDRVNHISLDLTTETYRVIPLPGSGHYWAHYCNDYSLRRIKNASGGYLLCLLCHTGSWNHDIYCILEDEKKWTKLISMKLEYGWSPVAYLKCKHQIVIKTGYGFEWVSTVGEDNKLVRRVYLDGDDDPSGISCWDMLTVAPDAWSRYITDDNKKLKLKPELKTKRI